MSERPKRYLPNNETAARYGVSTRTISRWVEDPELGFPNPLKINDRLFFDEEQLEAWERAQAAASRKAA